MNLNKQSKQYFVRPSKIKFYKKLQIICEVFFLIVKRRSNVARRQDEVNPTYNVPYMTPYLTATVKFALSVTSSSILAVAMCMTLTLTF